MWVNDNIATKFHSMWNFLHLEQSHADGLPQTVDDGDQTNKQVATPY